MQERSANYIMRGNYPYFIQELFRASPCFARRSLAWLLRNLACSTRNHIVKYQNPDGQVFKAPKSKKLKLGQFHLKNSEYVWRQLAAVKIKEKEEALDFNFHLSCKSGKKTLSARENILDTPFFFFYEFFRRKFNSSCGTKRIA